MRLYPVTCAIDVEAHHVDRFRQPIKKSAYGTRVPQIRENIGRVLTSPIQNVQNWITTPPPRGLSWTQHWKDKPGGKFTDKIQALNVDKDLLTQNNSGRRSFVNSLQANGGVVMQVVPPATHIWEMSVNGAGITDGTRNTFSSTVSNTQQKNGGTQIQIRSTYRAIPQ